MVLLINMVLLIKTTRKLEGMSLKNFSIMIQSGTPSFNPMSLIINYFEKKLPKIVVRQLLFRVLEAKYNI